MARPKSPPETRRLCHGVWLELNLANFAPHSHGKNGWMPRCRVCIRQEKRVWERTRRASRGKPRPPHVEGSICDDCSDLAHRRPETGCARCRGSYAPESPIDIRDYLFRDFQRAV